MSHPLTYDTLPQHSTLRREVEAGVLKVIAATQEPDARMKRLSRTRSAVPAALLSGALLLAFVAALASTYLSHRRYIGAGLGTLLFASFVIFFGALFLLVWKSQYAARIGGLERALRQATIIAASPGRLSIETTGPLGAASHDLLATELALRVGRCTSHPNLACLQILRPNRIPLQLLAGRDDAELQWVARAVGSALRGR
jgi:hypothetical protein